MPLEPMGAVSALREAQDLSPVVQAHAVYSNSASAAAADDEHFMSVTIEHAFGGGGGGPAHRRGSRRQQPQQQQQQQQSPQQRLPQTASQLNLALDAEDGNEVSSGDESDVNASVASALSVHSALPAVNPQLSPGMFVCLSVLLWLVVSSYAVACMS